MDYRLLNKSYDLRGIYGTEIDEAGFEKLARAFAEHVPGKKFALGHDARTSSPSLSKAFAKGLLAAGKDVVDLGLCSSDMLQFATVRYEDVDAGFMITASHNPKEYNGLKSCLKNAKPLNLKDWGELLNDSIVAGFSDSATPGRYETKDVVADWVEHVASFAKGDLSGKKVVADAGNGVAGVFLPALAKKLGLELVPLFFEPDGTFPNHHPSPIESKNTRDMVAEVLKREADIGVAFDGDADRAVVCDEKGHMVSASALICSIAESVLLEKPGATILYNAVTSRYVPEFVESLGGKTLKGKVGHVYLKQMMEEDPSIEFGGEHSGHYYFRKNANADSGAIAFVLFLSNMARLGGSASALRSRYEKYPAIEETNFRVADVAAAIAAVEKAYPEAEKDFFDGITLSVPDFRINLRPSSNEPLLRLNLEAENVDVLQREFRNVDTLLSR